MAEQSRNDLPFWDCVKRDLARVTNRRPGLAVILYRYLADCGFKAVFLHRVAHLLHSRGHLRLANLLTAKAIAKTGAEIKPAARIGPGLEIKHPVGIVVGAGVRIGEECTLLQGVTLGEKYSMDGTHEYPTLGDKVTVCAGAAVLGETRIGDGALVGAHAVVINDIPPGARAVGAPAVCLKISGTERAYFPAKESESGYPSEQEFRRLTLR